MWGAFGPFLIERLLFPSPDLGCGSILLLLGQLHHQQYWALTLKLNTAAPVNQSFNNPVTVLQALWGFVLLMRKCRFREVKCLEVKGLEKLSPGTSGFNSRESISVLINSKRHALNSSLVLYIELCYRHVGVVGRKRENYCLSLNKKCLRPFYLKLIFLSWGRFSN